MKKRSLKKRIPIDKGRFYWSYGGDIFLWHVQIGPLTITWDLK